MSNFLRNFATLKQKTDIIGNSWLMKTKIIIAAMLLAASTLMAQKTVEKRTWRGTGSSGAYVMKNGELIPVEEAEANKPTAEVKQTENATAEEPAPAPMTIVEVEVDNRTGSYRMAKEYYAWAGKCYLSFLSAGYTFDLADNIAEGKIVSPMKHVVDVSILDWRTRCFGMSLLNFEMEMGSGYADKIDHRAIYKPSISFYIPLCKVMALRLYGGAEADMSYVYKANKNYDYDYDRDFFFNVDAGLGVQIVPHGVVPIEINCEYRYPIESLTKSQDRLTQGFYLTGRVYFGMPF